MMSDGARTEGSRGTNVVSIKEWTLLNIPRRVGELARATGMRHQKLLRLLRRMEKDTPGIIVKTRTRGLHVNMRVLLQAWPDFGHRTPLQEDLEDHAERLVLTQKRVGALEATVRRLAARVAELEAGERAAPPPPIVAKVEELPIREAPMKEWKSPVPRLAPPPEPEVEYVPPWRR